MQAYQYMLAEGTTLVLSTESDLFKFLKGMDPDVGAGTPRDGPATDSDIVRRE
jgi:membrane protease subunit HflC